MPFGFGTLLERVLERHDGGERVLRLALEAMNHFSDRLLVVGQHELIATDEVKRLLLDLLAVFQRLRIDLNVDPASLSVDGTARCPR